MNVGTESSNLRRHSPEVTSYGSMPDAAVLETTEETPSPYCFRAGNRGSLRNLPDLTQRLIEAGIHAEYMDFRDRYHQWRRGEPKGSVGELTATALRNSPTDPTAFEYWYPTASIFRWRYTLVYWESIIFLVGAFLFTFDAAILYFHPPGGGWLTMTVPNAIGAFLFSVGTYFSYVKLINIATPAEDDCTYIVPDWSGMREKNCQWSSIIGTIAYMVGAWVFNIGSIGELFLELPPTWDLILVTIANVAGSTGFLLGGFCELIHNGVLVCQSNWRDSVWWASIMNTMGGMTFLAASLAPLLFDPGHGWNKPAFVHLNYMVGSACFVVSSVLMIMMWQANEFGLTLLGQLNFMNRSRGSGQQNVRHSFPDESQKSRFGSKVASTRSLRPVFFILVYCWFTFVALANCLFREQRFALAEERAWFEMVLDLLMQVFVVIVIFLVLVIHSVVSEVPDEQPYWCALFTLRGVLICGAMVQTVWLIKFWSQSVKRVVAVVEH